MSVITPECPTIFLIIVWLIPASANIEMHVCLQQCGMRSIFANAKAKIVLGEQIREKSKGRNHDLSVMEYMVLKEGIRYDELKGQTDEKQQENELLEREKKQLAK